MVEEEDTRDEVVGMREVVITVAKLDEVVEAVDNNVVRADVFKVRLEQDEPAAVVPMVDDEVVEVVLAPALALVVDEEDFVEEREVLAIEEPALAVDELGIA